MPNPDPNLVASRLQLIEDEMKRINFWQDTPIDPAAMNFKKAFAMDTMAYTQWLQFIFIPRVKQIIAEHGKFPSSSSVGTQAIREFDGQDQANNLVTLLCEFDALFE
jgi:uncharacterized protein YqcC (DUF446 family)